MTQRYILMIIVTIISMIPGFNSLMGQQKGIFEKVINFKGQSITVAYYVPESYDPANSSPLVIGLHCGGCNGIMMRGMLKPMADKIGALLVCPDDPTSNGKVIQTVINSVRAEYNADRRKTIITGYSMGGTGTFHYGFENADSIGGIIGIAPAVSNFSSLDYKVTKKLPVGIIVGSNDDFIDVTQTIAQSIRDENGKLKFIEKQGVNHMDPYFSTEEFRNDWIECYNFIIQNAPSTVTDFSGNVKVMINPSPVLNEATIKIDGITGKLRISLCDYLGSEVETLFSGYNQSMTLDLNFQNREKGAGIYFLRIQCDRGEIVEKVVLGADG